VNREITFRPPTILIVEDSPDDALVIQMTFEDVGIGNPLVFVEDGHQALDYLLGRDQFADRDEWPLPMLVILDINLPKLTGFQVLEATKDLRSEHNIEVLVLSVSSTPDDVEKGLNLGARRVLPKPIAPEVLLQVVSDIERFSLIIVAKP
jgi:CheY-like chemotaxis protein